MGTIRVDKNGGSKLDLIHIHSDIQYNVSIQVGVTEDKLVFLSCLIPSYKRKRDVNNVVFKDYFHSKDVFVAEYLQMLQDDFSKYCNTND